MLILIIKHVVWIKTQLHLEKEVKSLGQQQMTKNQHLESM